MHLKKISIKLCLISTIMLMPLIFIVAQETKRAISYTENDTSLGITVGHAVFINNLEVSIHNTTRISSSFCIEMKVHAGLVNDTGVVPESRKDKYFYGGLSPTLLFGKYTNFFEISFGGAYFKIRTETNSGKPDRNIPVGSIGYRRVFNNSSFRIGIGAPNGLYLGFTF